GVGLAAPQVGVQQRFFVYDVNDDTGPHVLVNPEVVGQTGEWTYEEGCLSLPGLAFEIVRPKVVTVQGLDLDGNEVVIEGDGLPVRTPDKAREVVDEVRASGAELGVVVAFGQLLPVSLLEALPLGFVNVHFSLLPRWRGAAPVERAILAGDAETGVCLMQLEAGLDTGPVYAVEEVAIEPNDTAAALRDRLVEVGTRLLVEQLPAIAETDPE